MITPARILSSIGQRIPNRVHLETRNVLGHEFTTRRGTIRGTPDKDEAWLFACSLRAKRIFDIGANLGYDALFALTLAPVEQIALVDPNVDALALAAENLARNGVISRARFAAAFASDRGDEDVTFWTVGVGAAGSMYQGAAKTAAAKGASRSVRTVTVDGLVQEFGFAPDFVKIDVEGAEAKVLAGSTGLARSGEARFLVEMHSPRELPMVENARLVLDWCGTHGYAAWFLAEHARVTRPEQLSHRGRCHLLLQPESWPYPDWLLSLPESAPVEAAAAGAELGTSTRAGGA